MKRRRRIADDWAECPWIVRFGIVLGLAIIVGSCVPGCAVQHVRPWGEVQIKDPVQRNVDPRWGVFQSIWIGVKGDF